MRVLSLNIRATQGGAGRMGYDLHMRLRAMGCEARLLYGYGSGIAPDAGVAGDPDIRMTGSRPLVIGNYIAHWLAGRELFTPGTAMLRRAIAWADIVHLHAAHHWYLRWTTIVDMLAAARKPVVATAHDWWLVSGRCGFTGDCTGWARTCGECGRRRFDDLPSLIDRSRAVRAARQRDLRRLRDRLVIVCPSEHIRRDHARVYPDLDIRLVPNALDRGYEAALAAAPPGERRAIVFCASDLKTPGKIDPTLVRDLAARHGDAIALVGRGNPFADTAATWHGEVRERDRLAAIFAAARVLVFTSRIDNAPLTIVEALSSGLHVVAYPSLAAAEMLALVGGRCAVSPDEARVLVNEGREAELFGGIGRAELRARALRVWSGERMAHSYLAIYRDLAGRAAHGALAG